MNMIEELFRLLDSLMERQFTINNVLEILGGEEDNNFLDEEVKKIELLIVKAFGGNEGHFTHIDSTDLFYHYKYEARAGAKEELIDYIKLTIENNWTDEVSINFRSV